MFSHQNLFLTLTSILEDICAVGLEGTSKTCSPVKSGNYVAS